MKSLHCKLTKEPLSELGNISQLQQKECSLQGVDSTLCAPFGALTVDLESPPHPDSILVVKLNALPACENNVVRMG